jgi:hypothetical protein
MEACFTHVLSNLVPVPERHSPVKTRLSTGQRISISREEGKQKVDERVDQLNSSFDEALSAIKKARDRSDRAAKKSS